MSGDALEHVGLAGHELPPAAVEHLADEIHGALLGLFFFQEGGGDGAESADQAHRGPWSTNGDDGDEDDDDDDDDDEYVAAVWR